VVAKAITTGTGAYFNYDVAISGSGGAGIFLVR
jgi:hypothetical protein